MKQTVFAAASVLLLLAAAVLLALLLQERKRRRELNSSLERFLQGGEQTPISTKDNDFSSLQNNVAELENKLLLEKSNTEAENKKNADFIADVSHQLKTPLAGLKLYCEMDAESGHSVYAEKELKLISKMEMLVKNLLKLEKLRSDAYEMDFAVTSVGFIVNELVSEYHHLFPCKSFSAKGDAEIRCDREWLREAIGNIIKNAAEHTGNDGTVDITVEKSECSVFVTVEDNGGGVAEEQLGLIFNRFFRTENASPESTGIGMAITRAVVQKHHGTVTAENGRKGLKVTICLPIIDANIKI